MKKKKGVAVILAAIFGSFGIHHFYLRNPGKGVLYIIIQIMSLRMMGLGVGTVLGWIDAVKMLMMSQRDFDKKYNWRYMRKGYESSERGRLRKRERIRTPRRKSQTTTHRKRSNPYKNTGLKKFRDFDITGSIQDFKKALEISPEDPSIHFKIACAYSLTEQTALALTHLEQAIEKGLENREIIFSEDSLAFLRIQPEFDAFVANDFSLKGINGTKTPKADAMDILNDLRQKRERGLITDEEFVKEIQRLNRE